MSNHILHITARRERLDHNHRPPGRIPRGPHANVPSPWSARRGLVAHTHFTSTPCSGLGMGWGH